MGFEVKRIENLLDVDLSHLVKESQEAGFRMLGRLVDDYEKGENTFNQKGEALYGVYNEQGSLIAIGGLNIDPFSNNHKIGRLRRFYVATDYRRSGIGTLLLNTIVSEAKQHYEILVLNTKTEEADRFYNVFGFHRCSIHPNVTHELILKP
ncbi:MULTISPECIES: GNAT family N-acetyltransferase [unclassified Bacillus (in: firmicutes)]|uniref:GNAT family N-acetyltransferase n=1 Tax=unclassified Bacillus (in: firmicutes) TaxID=185979 RepID=UPI0008E8E267|nr:MULTISPECIES: GNAT family N-acetyltransferase [unclassified Bacillus (in: firmicutes)]SFB11729.1 Acetyltransferase (GNAT) domain-containing protein [Bacillus sp. UNCCL13]SFQ90450.1 Acetyltransferase (GNAT) domain-containing protein [Bacillus sp. cl95]